MIGTLNLLYEPNRRSPWIVRWWAEPDPDTGAQHRPGKAFRHHRDAKAFLAAKRDELADGTPVHPVVNVTLGCLLAEFAEARLAGLSYASQMGYKNTFHQLLEQILQNLISFLGLTHFLLYVRHHVFAIIDLECFFLHCLAFLKFLCHLFLELI